MIVVKTIEKANYVDLEKAINNWFYVYDEILKGLTADVKIVYNSGSSVYMATIIVEGVAKTAFRNKLAYDATNNTGGFNENSSEYAWNKTH